MMLPSVYRVAGLRRRAVLILLAVFVSACGGGSPTSPSSNGQPASRAVAVSVIEAERPSGAAARTSISQMDRALVASFDLPRSGPSVVTFPPRNEPLAFRTALETKYRDGLRRPSVQTYVDQEGTVVWTQEYLRYRVNLCSHADAVSRVLSQIDGQGIPATCGTANTATFPPRNEPLAFMIELEAKYRDGLRRPSGPSFVDVEGNIVWTQEYLRYRVSSCSHADAQQRVFDQIDGRGVQADCTPVVVVAPTPTPTPTPSRTRIGAVCNDGTLSDATGSGACSSHGGVRCWRYNDGSCTNP